MIVGIGIDSVEIKRFEHWCNFSEKKLLRIFSPKEIDYCLQNRQKSAERFAVRFAAREALYKALSSSNPNWDIPLLTLCKYTQIERNPTPHFIINTSIIPLPATITTFLSLTHTTTTATAQVILQQNLR